MTLDYNTSNAQEVIKKSLFLFGAGATKDAGCLISSEMLSDIYHMDLNEPEKEAFDFLLSALHYHSSWKNIKERKKPNESNGHQPNIEDLMLLIRRIIHRDSYLPYPITGSWADKINFLEIAWRSLNHTWEPEKPKTLFETLEIKIITWLMRWLNIGEERTEYLQPISTYLKDTAENSSSLEFFTLNYDLVFEKHFNQDNVTLLNTGFLSGYYEGFPDVSTNQSTRINLYKLHGSINWEKDETGRVKESFYHTENKQVIVRVDKENSEKKDTADFIKIPRTNAHIIFGHGGKLLSVDPFISLLYYFKKQLESKDIFIVIGYSFFDPYINNMLLEGLSKEGLNSKLMVVVNPQFSKDSLLSEDERNGANSDELQKSRFIDHIQSIQKSTYLSDLPDFNLLEVSPHKIKIIPSFAKDFFSEYFNNCGRSFASLLTDLEEDNIF